MFMSAIRVLILLCVLLEAGWMAFDGGRALIVGDYVTSESGPDRGEIGPWRHAVTAVGLDPRGTPMKVTFCVYGVGSLLLAVGFARGLAWSWTAMVVAAIGALWYLPLGTVLSGVQIVLLLTFRSRLN